MEIQINDRFMITSDNYQFIVKEKKVNQDKDSKNYGQEYWANITGPYCNTLETALERIIDYTALTSDATSIKQFYIELQLIKEDIKNALKECE